MLKIIREAKKEKQPVIEGQIRKDREGVFILVVLVEENRFNAVYLSSDEYGSDFEDVFEMVYEEDFVYPETIATHYPEVVSGELIIRD